MCGDWQKDKKNWRNSPNQEKYSQNVNDCDNVVQRCLYHAGSFNSVSILFAVLNAEIQRFLRFFNIRLNPRSSAIQSKLFTRNAPLYW
mmetsp:Transcript_27305/g.41303  ORF Transcript_27305/g.41303 Transcript_27305/m.41303 type:complete len:88 (+) Transcript_27305:874-1137(+)